MSPSPAAPDIRASIESAAHAAGHTLDEHQLQAVHALAEFGAALGETSDAPGRGLYLWGTVGRGKTWLADAFVSALPPKGIRRLHFHSFYRQLHANLYRDGRPRAGAIDEAIDTLLDHVNLLYFDEFHLHDAGDATLALRVLRRIAERGIPLLATSNYPPSGLLPDPLFHHLFEPGIRLIESTMQVVTLDGTTDYRRRERPEERRQGFARGSWEPYGLRAEPTAGEAHELRSSGKGVTARRADDSELWITFAELCERPTSPSDYLEWAERWSTWVVEGVPRLTTCSPQARQRFLNLVDVLNDRGVAASFLSELSPEEVLEGTPVPTERGAVADREELGLGVDGLPIDVARTASRLALLRRPVASSAGMRD
ncbi:cell division protein ZapE [Salinibacterium sp. GXW1014]|uniref:cell division protein ZapE n=1 Tax=Salinibacterium sp. GXW1014 TaxID=3377838 RepID=UPI00383AB8AF